MKYISKAVWENDLFFKVITKSLNMQIDNNSVMLMQIFA